MQPWPRPIVFQLHELPHYACTLDHLVYEEIPGVPEEDREWFWRFPICVGIAKKAASISVIEHCAAAYKCVTDERQAVLAYLAERFPEIDSAAMLQDWLDTFTIMTDLAKNSDECSWFSPLTKEDSAYLEDPAKRAKQFLDFLDKHGPKQE